jgi:hypothetical protein
MARKRRQTTKRVQITKITTYRDKRTGRFLKKKTAREVDSERVRMDVQRSEKGRILRGYEVLSRKTTIKTATVDGITGSNPGRIDWALFRTNITTRLKNARRFEITIRGRDKREKHRRIKHVIHVGKGTSADKAYPYLVHGIISALRKRGYRTQYNLETATYSYEKSSKSRSRKLKPLKDVEITVKVIRK